MNTDASEDGTRLGKRMAIALAILFICSPVTQISYALAAENSAIIIQRLTLTVYLDGFALAAHEFEINQTYPTVNISLLGETRENLLFLDEQSTPLDYSITNDEATVYSLGASVVKASYFTQDLLTKTGKYWTLRAEVSTNTTVILPEAVTIISLNDVPERIESSNGQVTLVMPPGTIDITYIAEHSSVGETINNETPETPWLLIAALSSLSIPAVAFIFLILRHKKTAKPKQAEPKETPAVDIDKLLAREKDLRQEEVQVVRFLAEKNGSAFEAELYDKLQLPRTTTWRLLKRLERMEIVDIKKSRRQNIVSIRKKYMKK